MMNGQGSSAIPVSTMMTNRRSVAPPITRPLHASKAPPRTPTASNAVLIVAVQPNPQVKGRTA